MNQIESHCLNHMIKVCKESPDPSHDILHVKRVVELAKKLCEKEKACAEVVVPAAYLHDCVYISKADSRRSKASTISADKAVLLLKDWGFSEEHLNEIHHAVAAHSFSAKIEAVSLEAKIVQDADRLDAMGAIGIARCFGFSGLSNRLFYIEKDPFCVGRTPNDSTNALDHFFIKLLKIGESLHTDSAKKEAEVRLETMRGFLSAFEKEIS